MQAIYLILVQTFNLEKKLCINALTIWRHTRTRINCEHFKHNGTVVPSAPALCDYGTVIIYIYIPLIFLLDQERSSLNAFAET